MQTINHQIIWMGFLNIDNLKVFECFKIFDCRQSKENIVIPQKKKYEKGNKAVFSFFDQ